MAVQLQQGRVIFRRWSRQVGVAEQAVPFSTLEDLFALCLQVDQPLLVDRVILEGRDASGAERVVTLAFQSVTVSPSARLAPAGDDEP